MIEDAIYKALSTAEVSKANQRITRSLRSFLSPTEITFVEDKARNLTIMELSSPDRPGLLARVGQTLDDNAVTIQAAKIQTLGERVEDVFFLTDQTGNRLNDDAICDVLKSALCKALDTDVAA
jgi:[protein-PII] uridylyltransferase